MTECESSAFHPTSRVFAFNLSILGVRVEVYLKKGFPVNVWQSGSSPPLSLSQEGKRFGPAAISLSSLPSSLPPLECGGSESSNLLGNWKEFFPGASVLQKPPSQWPVGMCTLRPLKMSPPTLSQTPDQEKHLGPSREIRLPQGQFGCQLVSVVPQLGSECGAAMPILNQGMMNKQEKGVSER